MVAGKYGKIHLNVKVPRIVIGKVTPWNQTIILKFAPQNKITCVGD